MTNDIVEADQPMATAAAVIEKKARQLVYDARYEVKGKLQGKKVDPVVLERMVLQQISKSKAIPAVITRARQMVSKKSSVKEEYISEIQESATSSVANALYKVFVEGVEKEQEEIHLDYLEELTASPDKKYKIRVTDPKTSNSYIRFATREKITELRGKGLKVELTEYGEPREGERKRGEDTARATGGGKKLDPVGKEDADVDNDGKHNDPNDKYIMKRRAAVGAAIGKRKSVKEELLTDGTTSVEGQNKKQITGNNVDNSSLIKVMPQDSSDPQVGSGVIKAGVELDGPVLTERAVSKAQQRFMGMVYAAKKGEKPASAEVAAAAKGMTKKEAKKFAKTKHKGLPVHKEAVEPKGGGSSPNVPPSVYKFVDELPQNIQRVMGGLKTKPTPKPTQPVKEAAEVDKGERDTRADYAYRAMFKNKLRSAIGVKNPMVLVDPEKLEKDFDKIATADNAKVACETNMPEGQILDERRREEKEAGTPRAPRDKALEIVKSSMRKMSGTPAGQRKKVPGQKPPAAGEYGGPHSPAQKVAARRDSAQRAQDAMHSPRD
jgi:hypothetical protein